jgi:hypothetical protein
VLSTIAPAAGMGIEVTKMRNEIEYVLESMIQVWLSHKAESAQGKL